MDREVAGDPLTQKLQSEIQRKARELNDRAVRLSNQAGWGGLAEAARLLTKFTSRPSIEIIDDIVTIWSLSVSLGAYVQQNEDALTNQAGMVDPLEADALRILRDLVTTAGPWIRRFPTGRLLDDEARQFSSSMSDIELATKFFQRVENAALIRDDDAKVVGVALNAGSGNGLQAQKAGGWGTKTVRNTGIAMIGILAIVFGGYGKEIGAGFARHSEIAQRIQKVFLEGEGDLIELLSHLPSDLRAALHSVLDAMRNIGLPPVPPSNP